MTSTRPYLLRAIHEWIIDNGLTPYLLVDATNEQAEIPREHVNDGKIILNISPTAINKLHIDNDWVSFTARFSGRPTEIFVPIPAALAIYAKENGKGMVFQPEEEVATPEPPKPPRGKPMLKVVK